MRLQKLIEHLARVELMNDKEIDNAIATLQAEKAKNARFGKGLQEDSINTTKPIARIQNSNPIAKPKIIKKVQSNQIQQVNHNELEELKKELESLKNQTQSKMLNPKPKNGLPWSGKQKIQDNESQSNSKTQQSQQNGQPKSINNIIDIIQKLEGNRPFITNTQKYGQALAASILAKTHAESGRRVNFEDEARKVIELKGGSYALIYKNGTPMRIAPYIWSLDQQTRRTWAIFTFNDFYGNKNPNPIKIWKTVSTQIVLTPVSHTSNMADGYGKGYLAKFDEGTQFQEALSLTDDNKLEEMRAENKHFLSSALTLWMDLSSYTKAKINIKLILIIFGVAAVAVLIFYIFKTHPNLLSSLTHL